MQYVECTIRGLDKFFEKQFDSFIFLYKPFAMYTILVVEILLPGSSKKEIRDKYELYEEAGVKEYWVINPTEQNIFVFFLEQEGRFSSPKVYTGGDKLNARAVPGLSINLNEIFAS
jgi:Uma2 family endonuclease